MIENKNWYNYVTYPWKGLSHQRSFMQCQKWKLLKQSVAKATAADGRSPCKYLKFYFILLFIFGQLSVQWNDF